MANKIVHPTLSFNNEIVKLNIHRSTLVLSQIANSLSLNILTIKLARQQKLQGFFVGSNLYCHVKAYLLFINQTIYGDVIYDQPPNALFSNKIESVQHNAVLVITGAIKGPSCYNVYQELGLEHLQQRRWMRRLCLFHKLISTEKPSLIHNLLP